MKNKVIYSVLACLLLLCSTAALAVGENDDGPRFILSDNPIWDTRGDLIKFGLTPRGTKDFTFASDVLISGNLSVTGTQTYTGGADFSGDLTLQNDEVISNSTDAVVSITFNDDAVEAGDFQLITSNISGEDANYIRISTYFEDDGSVQTEAGRMDFLMDDETSNTFDSSFNLSLVTGDTLAEVFGLSGSVAEVTFAVDAAELGDFKLISSNTSGEDNNYIRISVYAEDDGSVQTEMATIDFSMDDETSNTFDSTIEWGVVTNDTYAAELNLNGAMLYPEANAGLDLGSDTYEFGSIWIDTTAYLDEANVTELVLVKATTALTSPSVAIDLAGGTWFEVTTDANQTGATLSNGVVGQIYTITMGAGSNTLRFDDDGLNLALGGNITLTEGEADALILLCYATDDFLCLSDRSGN